MAGALCVLGSATPSVESYYLSRAGRIQQARRSRERAKKQLMPEVEVVDLARYPGNGPSGHPLLTAPLHRALERCLAAGEQAILFLNRRGFAPSLRCGACSELLRCPACSVSLTEHRRAGCCAATTATSPRHVSEACPACGALALERVGVGTERIEDALTQHLPGRARGAARPRHGRRPRASRRCSTGCATREARHPGGHADGDQGPRPARGHAGGRAAGRPEPGLPRLSRLGAHVSAAGPGGGPRRPRRPPGPRGAADLPARRTSPCATRCTTTTWASTGRRSSQRE